ncbi:MAG: histidine kinase [Pelagibacteraceae bacterium]|nr:histidine kinase [Pelagibacteraceae bacterium]
MFRNKLTISPLLLRLLTLNILALFFLLGGLFSIDRYQQTLEENEFKKLEDEGRILSQAIGRTILPTDDLRSQVIITREAQETISYLLNQSRVRIRLFSYQGDLLADSERSVGYQTRVKSIKLPSLQEKNFFRIFFEKIYSYISLLIVKTSKLSIYKENTLQQAEDYEEVLKALYGEETRFLRQLENGKKMFSVAIPVQSYKKISGAIMLTLDSSNIENKLKDFRFEVFKIFFLALFLTICVSIYLSVNIVRPIRKLATATRNINPSDGRKISVPQFTDRKDEINELAFSIKEMLNSIWNRMDAIENFAADVAHEIKNPLTSLKSAVEVANKTRNRKQLNKLSKVINQDIQRLDRLVTDISNASRLDAELSREGMKNFNIRKVLEGTINFYNRDKKKIIFNFEKNLNYSIHGNKQRLSQVFSNLIDNALSFNKQNAKIEVLLKSNKNNVIIEIMDFGPGIHVSDFNKIFERFYTERPSNEKFGEHSGLGLSIVKQILEVHKGIITAENRLDKNKKICGAKFIVTLKKII